eukprot:7044649-Prymnesium_polylepis.1
MVWQVADALTDYASLLVWRAELQLLARRHKMVRHGIAEPYREGAKEHPAMVLTRSQLRKAQAAAARRLSIQRSAQPAAVDGAADPHLEPADGVSAPAAPRQRPLRRAQTTPLRAAAPGAAAPGA